MSESDSADRASREAMAGPSAREIKRRRGWVPGVASLLCLLIGLSDVLAIFKPAWHEKLHRLYTLVPLPGTLTNVTRSADVIIGLMLLMLSRGLRRRKRRAWQAVLGLLAVDVVVHLQHPSRPYSAVVAGVLLAALVFFRDDFYAVGDPRTRWSALRVFAVLAAADLGIGLGFLAAGGLAGRYPFGVRLQDVVYELAGVYGPVGFASEGRGDLYHLLTSALGLFTLAVTVYLFLRPARPRARLGAADAARIRGLLARHGERDSLGYFALRDDKSVIWSPSGKACVCYRVVAGVMLAAGDPVGDPEAWPGALAEFLAVADRHAWRPAVMGCSELGAEVWCREGGLAALELGDEAVISVAGFGLSGRAMRHFGPWGGDGLSLDLMRRDRAAQPGVNEFLIAETVRAAPGLGVRRVSLNFAMFRAALERGERIGAGPVLRAWRALLVFASRWFQIESLYKFNAKFCPAWQPRFFVYPATRDAPRIALAALQAEAFLVWPRPQVRRRARRIARAIASATPARHRTRTRTTREPGSGSAFSLASAALKRGGFPRRSPRVPSASDQAPRALAPGEPAPGPSVQVAGRAFDPQGSDGTTET